MSNRESSLFYFQLDLDFLCRESRFKRASPMHHRSKRNGPESIQRAVQRAGDGRIRPPMLTARSTLSAYVSVQHPAYSTSKERDPTPRFLEHSHNANSLPTASSTRVLESSSTRQRGGRSLSLARCQILSIPVGTGCS
ncbi:hypothetical protein SCHPADRAFT_748784 [Schizopora paradoxa]|uniref:Uncharacterized protein n=1 Tax=Schizopora paradoxa TaxID=27342 RepID=A0A0H2R591_9AGAM|nr:hypothetical protein SCHPADRAFT_748784 [Schizopora paradoxa]